ncbi:hypothetical protein LTR64_004027 [Lithohypha guttulata]|uniref:uncharacterized protein n=1 Tax=Lithohypha guttulata TaxID=1690604 RepID=UPI002DE188F9|nr:hypothetical protein LTR51_006679 [Lithohypha guttulata]
MEPRSLLTPSPRSSTPGSPMLAGMSQEQPPKLKGRQRLLQGLQRMSSSPSLAKMGRTRSSEKVYKPNHKASISCVSLGSSPQGSSISPPIQVSTSAYATPPGTPGTPTSVSSYVDSHSRFRPFDLGSAASSAEHLQLRPARTPLHEISEKPLPKRENFNFWGDLPQEVRIQILSYLPPKEIVRLSAVSRSWQEMCFDGQLWTVLDCQTYYQKITSEALMKIMLRAGAFVKNLNLRGCVQLRDQWLSLGTRMTNQECRNLETFSIEGCKIERSSIHFFLLRNPKLLHLNMPSMQQVSNATLKIIAAHCRNIEYLNINWCTNCDNRGLLKVVQSCPNLTDLRVSEVRGLDDTELALEMFRRNNLERLIMAGCDSLTDEVLEIMVQGVDPQVDVLTDRVTVPPRRWRHLDVSECRQLTDRGVRALAHNVPFLEGLKLCKVSSLTDDALLDVMSSVNRLTHLELEELEHLTNEVLIRLAKSPAAKTLEHLSISYCDQMGDVGVLPILKSCPELKSLCLDNTRISDLALMEASEQVRKRGNLLKRGARPKKGLELIAFDCANVTWAGVREIMQGNCRVLQGRKKSVVRESLMTHLPPTDSETESITNAASASASQEIKRVIEIQTLLFPAQIIHLKAFHIWQATFDAHYQRCMTARWVAASRLENKWAEWMVATEEVGNISHGWGARRRRRRQREAENRVREDTAGLVHDTEGVGTGTETEDMSGLENGSRRPNRRRARSGGCAVM